MKAPNSASDEFLVLLGVQDCARRSADCCGCAHDSARALAWAWVDIAQWRAQMACWLSACIGCDASRTVVGDEDEADGGDVQATDGEQPGLQRTVRVLPPPLRHKCITAILRVPAEVECSVEYAVPNSRCISKREMKLGTRRTRMRYHNAQLADHATNTKM